MSHNRENTLISNFYHSNGKSWNAGGPDILPVPQVNAPEVVLRGSWLTDWLGKEVKARRTRSPVSTCIHFRDIVKIHVIDFDMTLEIPTQRTHGKIYQQSILERLNLTVALSAATNTLKCLWEGSTMINFLNWYLQFHIYQFHLRKKCYEQSWCRCCVRAIGWRLFELDYTTRSRGSNQTWNCIQYQLQSG